MINHNELLKPGNWVTQYRKGIWQIIDIKPKYAEEDIQIGGISYLKGDLIGQWAILKKAFSSKMKFQIDFDVCDLSWCHLVSNDVLIFINDFFDNNPINELRFQKTNYIDKPAICTIWMNVSEEQAECLLRAIPSFPPLFSMQYLMSVLRSFSIFSFRPPSNYVLYLQHSLWEYNNDHEELYKAPVFLKNDDSIRTIIKTIPGY